jgi:hypothetical protein
MATKHTELVRWSALGSHCHYCRRPLGQDGPEGTKTRDHKQPLSRGGSNHASNIVACCDKCNQTKGHMTEAEFFGWIARGRPNKFSYMREIGLLPALVAQRIEQRTSNSQVAGSSPAECAT